jgi:hypothetical protein
MSRIGLISLVIANLLRVHHEGTKDNFVTFVAFVPSW